MRGFNALVFIAAASTAALSCNGNDRPAAAGLPDAGDAAAADATDAQPSGSARGNAPRLPPADVTVRLPYEAPPVLHLVTAAADPARADVQLLVDTTGSFTGEIDNLQADLEVRIIPALQNRIAGISFGVARFEDFPRHPFGASSDRPFELLTGITNSTERIRNSVDRLDQPLGNGGDPHEAGSESLWQIATGQGYIHDGEVIISAYVPRNLPGGGALGGVGFRTGALHLVIQITDAPFHQPSDYGSIFPGTRGLDQAITELQKLDAVVLGIASSEFARPDLEAAARATGGVIDPVAGSCPTGIDGSANPPVAGQCPLVFDLRPDGSGLANTLVDAVISFVNALRYEEVTARVSADPLLFVKEIAAVSASPPPGVSAPVLADLYPPDGITDAFLNVGPGTALNFSLTLQNDRLPAARDYDQIFPIHVEVVGDGVILLAQTLRIIVPADPSLGFSDAGINDGS